jgi:hypothetical protein
VIRRYTQDPDYWKDLKITPEDLGHLSNVLVDREIPLPLDSLTQELVKFRFQREENRIATELAKGTIYLPKNSYKKGEVIVFPALEYEMGTVASVRDGHNPEYGEFKVVKVDFPEGKSREFATELGEHPLNEALQTGDEQQVSGEEILAQFGTHVQEVLNRELESDPMFIRLAGEWFVRDLLVDINEGHLNIAEAVLDVADGGPLPTPQLIDDLDLSKEVKPQLGVFSLNYALQEDERFDEVGPAGEVLWYLRRLQPPEVLNPPYHLLPQDVEYDHRLLDETMLNLERTLDDEWSDLVAPPEVESPVSIVLTFPHRRSGTLPLSSNLMRVFPTGRTHRIRFMFRDVDSGDEMEGWVVRERRFVYGLKDWYEKHDIPVGAYLDLSRADEPGVVQIRRRAKRTRREWVRVTTVEDGRLTFEMSRHPLSCEVDDQMIIAVEDFDSLDTVSQRVQDDKLSLQDIVSEIVPELAKLSPQGNAHAATVYSAVNIATRTPPGPILATLVNDGKYTPIGDNYWIARSRESDL